MKIKTSKETLEDGDGELQGVQDRFSVSGEYGELKFKFSIAHVEGISTNEIKKAITRLARKIETGTQIDVFEGEAA